MLSVVGVAFLLFFLFRDTGNDRGGGVIETDGDQQALQNLERLGHKYFKGRICTEGNGIRRLNTNGRKMDCINKCLEDPECSAMNYDRRDNTCRFYSSFGDIRIAHMDRACFIRDFRLELPESAAPAAPTDSPTLPTLPTLPTNAPVENPQNFFWQ